MSFPATDLRSLRVLFALAALSYLPALGWYLIGEEAILPLTSLEMWQRGSWLKQYLYGLDVQHNPLYNWISIPLSVAVGWEHSVAVARGLIMTSVVLTGVVLAGLARALFGDARFAALAALMFVTLGDLFFYRGMLAYIDPMFGLEIFAGIAALWIGCERRRHGWLAVAALAITAAFMTKALTAYVFYGAAGLVLLARREYRGFLLSPGSIAIHGAMLAWPAFWYLVVLGGGGQGTRMATEIVHKLEPAGLRDYFVKLVDYPLRTALRLAPALFLVLWFLLQRRERLPEPAPAHVWTAAAIVGLNFLPYWLAPHSHTRYLIPLFPLVALLAARVVWRSGEDAVRLTLRWLAAALVVKLAVVLAVVPYYQVSYRGANYLEAAQDIDRRAAGQTLYSVDVSAAGLNVTTYLNLLRLPEPAIRYAPREWDDGLVLSGADDPALGRRVYSYRLGGDELHVLCRGAACDAWK